MKLPNLRELLLGENEMGSKGVVAIAKEFRMALEADDRFEERCEHFESVFQMFG